MYLQRTVYAGNEIFVTKYNSSRYGIKTTKAKKTNSTSLKQRKINSKNYSRKWNGLSAIISKKVIIL